MIKIIIDEYEINRNKENVVLIIENINDYLNNWSKILQYIECAELKTILLKDISIKPYFVNLKEKFKARISFKEINPKSLIEKELSINILEEFKTAELVGLITNDKLSEIKIFQFKRVAFLAEIINLINYQKKDLPEIVMETILEDTEKRYPIFLSEVISELINSLCLGWGVISGTL